MRVAVGSDHAGFHLKEHVKTVLAGLGHEIVDVGPASPGSVDYPQFAADAAHELFSVLRAFDDEGVQLIWVEEPPATPEWEGVRDRLRRAAAS